MKDRKNEGNEEKAFGQSLWMGDMNFPLKNMRNIYYEMEGASFCFMRTDQIRPDG